jgi:hypothetical protein
MATSSNKEGVQVASQRLDDGSLSIHLTVSDLGPVVTKIQTQQMEGLNRYLASGNGRGRLNSAATIYQGKVGYFFVSKMNVGGEQQEAIFFSYDTGGDESGLGSSDTILITHFPAQKKG